MNAGRLTEIMEIERAEIKQDGFGANDLDWQVIIRTRADVQYQNGGRANENGEIVFNYDRIFTTRIYHQIKETDRIVWDGHKWRILSIEPDKQKQLLKIVAEKINE